MEGKVKWFSKEKGFGWITAAGDVDYFFHVSQLKGAEIADSGDTVSFAEGKGKDGRPRANDVVLIKKAEPQAKSGYYGKPTYKTETHHRSGLGEVVGSLGGPVGQLVGGLVGSLLGFGSTTHTTQTIITRECIRCGGTAHVTGKSSSRTGFQCSNCNRFWQERG